MHPYFEPHLNAVISTPSPPRLLQLKVRQNIKIQADVSVSADISVTTTQGPEMMTEQHCFGMSLYFIFQENPTNCTFKYMTAIQTIDQIYFCSFVLNG